MCTGDARTEEREEEGSLVSVTKRAHLHLALPIVCASLAPPADSAALQQHRSCLESRHLLDAHKRRKKPRCHSQPLVCPGFFGKKCTRARPKVQQVTLSNSVASSSDDADTTLSPYTINNKDVQPRTKTLKLRVLRHALNRLPHAEVPQNVFR